MKNTYVIKERMSVIKAVNNFAKSFTLSKVVIIRKNEKVEFVDFNQMIAFFKNYMEADKRHKVTTSAFNLKYAILKDNVLTLWDGIR